MLKTCKQVGLSLAQVGSEPLKDASDISQFDKQGIAYYVSPTGKHVDRVRAIPIPTTDTIKIVQIKYTRDLVSIQSLVLEMAIRSDLSDLAIGSASCTYIAVGLFEQFRERKWADAIEVEACRGVEPPAGIGEGVTEHDHLPNRHPYMWGRVVGTTFVRMRYSCAGWNVCGLFPCSANPIYSSVKPIYTVHTSHSCHGKGCRARIQRKHFSSHCYRLVMG